MPMFWGREGLAYYRGPDWETLLYLGKIYLYCVVCHANVPGKEGLVYRLGNLTLPWQNISLLCSMSMFWGNLTLPW